MSKTNKIILSVLLACSGCIASGGSVEYGPSCSSEVPEIVTPEESSSARRDEALERVLDNHFPQFRFPKFKQELQAAQDAYHTAVPTIEKRSAISALDKMLNKLGPSYMAYANHFVEGMRSFTSRLDMICTYLFIASRADPMYLKNNGMHYYVRISDGKYLSNDGLLSIFREFTDDKSINHFYENNPLKMENVITNPSIYDDNTIVDSFKDALLSRNEDDLEKIILDPNLPIHLFSTIFKEFIEEYRILRDVNIAFIKADFKDICEFNRSLSAYRSFKRALNSYEDAARLAASSKAINDRVIS
jgi:hypothetical protein